MSDLNSRLINETLIEDVLEKFKDLPEVFLIHDPSDIRKPHTKESEHLGQVRDLSGKIINGYSSYNVVAANPKNKSVHLLSHELYSNKEPGFLRCEDIKKLESGKSFEGEYEAKLLYESGDYFNKKSIGKETLKRMSVSFKERYPDIKLTHILDREFDDDDYHREIKEVLKDDFVGRSKKSRTTLGDVDKEGKKQKLMDALFETGDPVKIQKIRLKKGSYQDVSLVLQWRKHGNNWVVKASLNDRNQQSIFKDPLLLITSKEVSCVDEAYAIYMIYLSRSRIESVFKFLKEGLGWEESQLQDYKAIENLLSLCFFVAAYLYEIGKQIAYEDYTILLAEVGGGKGKVTRHYILEGIKKLTAKYWVDKIFKENKVSQEMQKNMMALAGIEMDDF